MPQTDPAAGTSAASASRGRSLPRLVAYSALVIGALLLVYRALQLPSSRWEPLGAGTFPAMILGALAALCALGIFIEVRSRDQARTSELANSIRAHRLVLIVLGVFISYVLALPWLGFGIATFFFLVVAQLVLAPNTRRSRAIALLLALIFSFGLEWLFAQAFGIFLPRAGLLE